MDLFDHLKSLGGEKGEISIRVDARGIIIEVATWINGQQRGLAAALDRAELQSSPFTEKQEIDTALSRLTSEIGRVSA